MKAGRLWKTILACCLWVPASLAQNGGTLPAAPSDRAPAGTETREVKGSATSTAAPNRARKRDPFHTLIALKKADASEQSQQPVHYPPGKKGLVIEQLALQGIARGLDGSWIAVVDNKTKIAYFLHEKDQLYNGVVSKIDADSIVFLENSTDASGKPASREVVKKLSAN